MYLNQALAAISNPDMQKALNSMKSETATEYELSRDLTAAFKRLVFYSDQLETLDINDPRHWETMISKTYWKAVVDIIKAALVVWPNNLPDMNVPPLIHDSSMQDACRIEAFAFRLLERSNMEGGALV